MHLDEGVSRRALLLLLGILLFAVVDGLSLYYLLGTKLTDARPNDDLITFINAARRMIESGTPYLPLHLDPSIALRPGWEIADAYVYPPLMAQLFVPLAGLDHTTAWNIHSGASAIAMLAAGLIAARVARVRLSLLEVVFGVLLLLPMMTIASTLWHGRPEPFIALAIAVALASGGAAAGAGVALAALLRLPTAAFGLPLLIAGPWRRVLIGGVGLTALIVAGGALLAPAAWSDYLLGGAAIRTVTGNIGIGLYDDAPHALVAFAFFQALNVPETWDSLVDLAALGPTAEAVIRGARVVELGLAVVLAAWSTRLARDARRRHAAVAAAVAAGLIVGGLLWEYHALPLLPVAIASFLIGGPGVRRALLIAYLLGLLSLLAFNVEVLSVDPLTGSPDPAIWPWRRVISCLSSVGIIALVLDAARRSRLPLAVAPARPRAARERD